MSWIEDPGISYFRGFNISKLGLDEAYLNVTSLVQDATIWVYELSSDCHKCPFERKSSLNFSSPQSFVISTKFPRKYRFRTADSGPYVKEWDESHKFCDIDENFGEFGVYNIELSGTTREPSCSFETALEPVSIYYPLLLVFLFYLLFGSLLFLVSKGRSVLKSCKSKSSSSGSSKTSTIQIQEKESHPIHGHGQGISVDPNQPPQIQNPNHVIYGNGGKRLSHGGPQPQPQPAYEGVYGYSNGNGNGGRSHYASNPNMAMAPTYNHNHSPNAGTEVSISTISSTPTVTTTSYGLPQSQILRRDSHVNSDTESPSASASTNSSRTPINGTISNSTNNNANGTAAQPQSRQRQRLRSLDTFRGICIIIMIFVNDGGAGYYFLEHATWDGLYVADLVFPWFLWIMGVCIPVSIKSQVKRGNSRWTILKRIFIRSCKLILIGILLGSLWGPVDIKTMRIPGVLQRFGLCYFVCCTLVLFCMTVNITKPETNKIRAALQDVEIIWIAWLFVLALVLLHCMLTFFLEVPGCPTGYLGPGGLHDYFYQPYQTVPSYCIGGAAGYIDKEVLTTRHIYQWPTAKGTYKADAYDPEGLLGTLTSIFQVFLGVQAGVTMLVYPRAGSRVKRYLAWALISGGLGALLHFTGWIPLNKNLWSISYVMVTNSFALLLLCVLYVLIDVKGWISGSPFFEPGMNSILLYVGHSVANSMLPWHYRWGPMRTHFSRLIECCWGTSLWAIIAIYLYKKKRFWTI